MQNDNETVEQVCEKMKEPSIYKGRFPVSFFDGEFREFADRILAAYQREIVAKDAEIVELRKSLDRFMDVTGDCRKCEECGDESCPWYGEPDGCNNREAREKFLAGELVDPLKAKDAEIARLKADYIRCRGELRATRERRDVCETKMRTALERVTRAESKCDALRSLIKELSDALWVENGYSYSELIANAREVIGGNK